MNVLDARNAIFKVFLDAWVAGGYSAANVRWDDVPGNVPATEVVWARVTLKHAGGGQTLADATSKRVFENNGTLWVQVFAPIGGGGVAVYGAAQIVLNAIRVSRNIPVWFRNARMNEVDGTSGAFEQINVLATFSYDDLR